MNLLRRDAACSDISKREAFRYLHELACGEARFPPCTARPKRQRTKKLYGTTCGVFPSHFECFPSMQIVSNPDLDADQYEIEVGRLIPLSGGNVDFPLGEGLLNFLYTDFEAACVAEQIDL